MRRIRVATALTLVAAGCGGPGRALAPIRLVPIGTLGAETGDGTFATDPHVSARHPRGFRILIPTAGGVAVLPLVFDDAGRFLGTLHGGRSDDERFQTPLFARFGPGDSIWVFDGAQRVLVFDPDRTYVRTVALPVSAWDALILPGSRMLIAPANADRPFPLRLLSSTGASIREIGASDSTAVSLHTPRWIVRGADGTFWSMPMQFRWRVEHWDTMGTLLGAMERRPGWFPPYTQVLALSRTQPPLPTVRGLWIDSVKRLWVLGMAAGRRWATGLGPLQRGQSGEVLLDPDKVFDTVIEVVNLTSGRTVATVRMDASYPSAVEPGVIMHIRQTAGGWKKAELMRVLLDGPRN